MREQGGHPVLQGKRVLIVEDDYLIAAHLVSEVAKAGCDLVGMAKSVDDALYIIGTADVDGAVVDVWLRGERTFQVADALAARHIPFAFVTGMSHEDVLPVMPTSLGLKSPSRPAPFVVRLKA
jgi:DNA-binding response OmpR family regulator